MYLFVSFKITFFPLIVIFHFCISLTVIWCFVLYPVLKKKSFHAPAALHLWLDKKLPAQGHGS